MHLSNPKPGHTTGGSGRGGARRGGGAGPGRTRRRQNGSPRRQLSLVPSKASKTRVLNISPEARTSEILCKAVEEPNPRLTSGLSAVDNGFISGTTAVLRSWLLTSGPTFFVSVNPFHARHVRECTKSQHTKLHHATLHNTPPYRITTIHDVTSHHII